MKFVCEECGEEFISDRDDEEALRESEKIFGQIDKNDLAVVCDDCFQEIINELPKTH